MGFLVFVLIVGVLVFFAAIFRKSSTYEETQRNVAISMYGGTPVVENDEPDIAAQLEKECARIEALIQATEAGHDDVHQQIEDGTYTGPWPERRNDGAWTSIFDDLRILSIAGINHRQSIVRYKGRNTVALVPEPQNEFDANAIKVLAEDGHHLGYIRRDQTEMVRAWARDEFPIYCTCRIEEREDDDDGHRFYVGFLYVLLKK